MKTLGEIPEVLSLGWAGMVDSLIIGNIVNSMSDSVVVIDAEGNGPVRKQSHPGYIGVFIGGLERAWARHPVRQEGGNQHFNEIFPKRSRRSVSMSTGRWTTSIPKE